MTINDPTTQFYGRTVLEWQPGMAINNPKNTAFRIGVNWEKDDGVKFSSKLTAFLDTAGIESVEALIIGGWDEMAVGDNSETLVQALADAADKLKSLEALFIGDVTFEECEISWIIQSDMTPIFDAYPKLKKLVIRGASDLQLGELQHANLESLTIESGGLDRNVVTEVANSNLPKLRHLELWLGDSGYGATFTIEDLEPIVEGSNFPSLEYLGLCNSEIEDQIAEIVAESPILSRLKTLDLSMGTLGDVGAEALLAAPAIKNLKKLDLSHNYCSEDVLERLKALGIEVDLSENEEAEEEDRYVAVGE